MSTPIERIRALLAAGEKATPGNWTWREGPRDWERRGLDSDHREPNHFSPLGYINPTVMDACDYHGEPVIVIEPRNETFVAQAANARPDIALLVKLVDAVRARRDVEAMLYQGAPQVVHHYALRETEHTLNAILAELEAQQ